MNDAKYWRCEYENLRRKKNKEIETLKYQMAAMSRKTYDLLKAIGLSHKDIEVYYRGVQ